MVPPIWPDEQGRPLPTYPCPRPGCGREVPVRFRGFRVEHLRHLGWQVYRVESYVNWCGHGQPLTADYFFSFFKSPHAKAFIVTP
jgi:hypothetical protein